MSSPTWGYLILKRYIRCMRKLSMNLLKPLSEQIQTSSMPQEMLGQMPTISLRISGRQEYVTTNPGDLNCWLTSPLTSGLRPVLWPDLNSSNVTTFDSYTLSDQCTAVRSIVAGRVTQSFSATPVMTPLVARNPTKIR